MNDNLAGALVVSGTSETLTGNQNFETGATASQNTTLGGVTITSGAQFLNQPRLEPGPQNFAITIPDSATGGNIVFQVYNPANLVALAPATTSTVVPDIVNVNDTQYINARIASVSNGGTLGVSIGSGTASSTSATHAWTMAAKQSSLFNVDGSSGGISTLNWNNNNRITFTGSAATPVSGTRAQLGYTVEDVATYKGAFSVQTLNGSSTSFNVTSAADLKTYNDWLIDQLKSGGLDKSSYLTNFNKAFSKANGTIVYNVTATPPDEATLPIGDRVLINATGANARVVVAANRVLEVSGATAGAIRATNGAQVRIDGKISSQGNDTTGVTDSSAISLNASSANNSATGVINGGFLNRADTSNSGIGLTSYNANGVNVENGSVFTNNGILNFATTGSNAPNGVAAINVGNNSSANNGGIINVGVNGSSATGTTSGVLLNTLTSAFNNFANGTIYIGRGLQNLATDVAADTAMNQSGLTSGIAVLQGGSGINTVNNGNIVIGSRSQNSAAMYINASPEASVRNHGTIDVNGRASATPRDNYGMLVVNSGIGDGILNDGTINLNGINGIGIKVMATNNNNADAASTGTINVAGAADPASGTRNFGVWVEGQGNGSAAATINGPINLTGNGAIGVHARGNGVVTVEGAATPNFSQGSNQIAFFAYGPNADINVASNTLLNVATTGSTLFRVEDGADFDGTNLLMTLSGNNSVGVMGSGAGTNVDTHNADMTISGNGATGVIIEGGATGVIDAATNLNLSGINAVGAIVDGQKHTLTGANSGAPVATTSLASSAALAAAQNGLTGYIARNLAQLTNSGAINFTGDNSTGILVQSGATASNTGDITINNGGTGILVNNATQLTTANNSGVINVNGGSVTARSRGVSAAGPLAVVNLNDGGLNLNGVGALGAQALAGAKINIATDSAPVFNNTDQLAFHALGAGSTINSASNDLDITTDRSSGYRIDDGAVLNFSGANSITTSGAQTTGVIVSGSDSNLTTGDSDITLTGGGSTGIRVEGGGLATLSAETALTINATNGIGVLVDNLRTDLANALTGASADSGVISSASVFGNGANAIGFDVANGAAVTQQGTLTLTGDNSIGMRGDSGSTLVNSGVLNIFNGTGVDVSGNGTSLTHDGAISVLDGIAGVRVSDGAYLEVSGSDTTITSSGTAHGILLDSGAADLAASDATITVNGSGNGIENAAETANIVLTNLQIDVNDGSGIRTGTPLDPATTVDITVNGAGRGLNLTMADDSPASGDFVLGDGYLVDVNGAGGVGIRANTRGNLFTASQVNINDPAGGAALQVDSATRVVNTGSLSSFSQSAPVVELNGGGVTLENYGTIAAVSPTALAIEGSGVQDTILLNDGAVTGEVNTGDGSDTVQWIGGTLDGSLTLGEGVDNQALVQAVDLSNTSHITSGSGTGNSLTLDQISARGGSFAADDAAKGVNLGSGWSTINFNQSQWTLTDNLQLAHSEVNIDSGSTLFAGNNVNPVISGGSDGTLVVNNNGTLDLTNGSGSPGNTLTIAGDLASQTGQANLVTRLNEGGALSNQFTDNLRVQGNASGTTLLNVTLDALSTDALTDLNHSSSVEAYEGISLAQVAGTADAASFVLAGGDLAVGPWSYQLYSFAPGTSDADQRRVAGGSDNQFWDYRIANVYLCENDNSCPTAPAVPGQPAPTNPQTPPVVQQPSAPDSPRLTNPPRDGCVVDGIDTCAPGRPAVIAQVPSYISAPMGITYYTAAIIDDLHKRLGELRHQQNLPQGNSPEMFIRYVGSDLSYKSDRDFKSFGYDMDINYNAMQIGGNLLRIDGQQDSLRAGIAYTRGDTRIRPKAADGYSKTSFDSNSVALYSTWQRQNGFYVDGVLSFDWHSGVTDTATNKDIGRPKGRGWSASVETGYPFALPYDIKLEPQAQLMYMQLNMKDFTDKEGTTVKYDDFNQTIGRVGARLDRSWTDAASRQYTPYLRANYYHGWGSAAKTTIGAAGTSNFDHTFTGGRFGQMVEVGVGGTTTFKQDVSLYAEADYRKELDSNGAKGWRYNVGVRWQF